MVRFLVLLLFAYSAPATLASGCFSSIPSKLMPPPYGLHTSCFLGLESTFPQHLLPLIASSPSGPHSNLTISTRPTPTTLLIQQPARPALAASYPALLLFPQHLSSPKRHIAYLLIVLTVCPARGQDLCFVPQCLLNAQNDAWHLVGTQ